MNLTKENVKKICGIILFTVVVLVIVQNYEKVGNAIGLLWGIIFPFVLGGIIAFILNIPMRAIEKLLFKSKNGKQKKYARPLSMIITFLLVIGVIAGVILIVVPQIGGTVRELTKSAEAFFPKVQKWAEDMFSNNTQIHDWIASLQFNTGLIFAFYLLAKKETLQRQVNMFMQAALPEKIVNKITYVAKLSNETFSNFITGQCLEALILGTMFFVTLSIIRLPYALLIGVLIAFTALIPIFGAFIGCIVGAFLMIMVSPMKALIFVIVFIVLQQIEGNLIYPKVVGGSVGLPSLWVLAAVTIGSSLMGVAGMLFFIPFTSVIYTLVREWTYKRLEQKKTKENNNDESNESSV